MSKRNIILLILLILIVGVAGFVYVNFFQKRVSQIPEMKTGNIQKTPEATLEETPRLSIVSKNLEIP